MSQSMRDDAATALEEMFAAAKEEGVTLSTVSGYRSYSKQSTIYARKKASQGEEEADRVSARPGTSEHQLGLAMDISKKNSSQLNTSFAETEEGQWVAANAHRFGFIVRYLKEYEDVTGYMYEPWHVRYVGKEQAQAIYESPQSAQPLVEQLGVDYILVSDFERSSYQVDQAALDSLYPRVYDDGSRVVYQVTVPTESPAKEDPHE